MCIRLSSREKKKKRNSPSRKTVGDKRHPFYLMFSIAWVLTLGEKTGSKSSLTCQGRWLGETAFCIFPTLAITWPQGVLGEEDS
jgi:hypothetical protein